MPGSHTAKNFVPVEEKNKLLYVVSKSKQGYGWEIII